MLNDRHYIKELCYICNACTPETQLSLLEMAKELQELKNDYSIILHKSYINTAKSLCNS